MDIFGDLPPPKSKVVEEKKIIAHESSKAAPVISEKPDSCTDEKRKTEPSSDSEKPKAKRCKTIQNSTAAVPPLSKNWQVCITQTHYGSKGRRQTMEDAHLAMGDAAVKAAFPDLPASMRVELYGIMDGHGGRNVADLVKHEIPGYIVRELLKCPLPTPKSEPVVRALTQAFTAMDNRSQAQARLKNWSDGCCVVLVVVVNDMVFVANMGDSKAVLCRHRKPDKPVKAAPLSNDDVGGDGSVGAHLCHRFPWHRGECDPPPVADALPLTQDHKPILLSERRRIEAAGGRIEGGRVNGAIEVARSFGDLPFKRFGVAAIPDLRVRFKLTPSEEFLLLGCDGLWARYSEANACTFLRTRLWAGTTWCGGKEHSWTLERATRGLVDDAVHAKGCQDNCSAMVLLFSHPEAKRMSTR